MSAETYEASPHLVCDSLVSPAIAAAATPTVAAVIPVGGKKILSYHFQPTVQALDKMRVRTRAHKDAPWLDWTPASWAAPPAGGLIKATTVHTTATGAFVDGDLDSVATTENGFLKFDCEGFTDVEIAFSAAVDGSLVNQWWSLAAK